MSAYAHDLLPQVTNVQLLWKMSLANENASVNWGLGLGVLAVMNGMVSEQLQAGGWVTLLSHSDAAGIPVCIILADCAPLKFLALVERRDCGVLMKFGRCRSWGQPQYAFCLCWHLAEKHHEGWVSLELSVDRFLDVGVVCPFSEVGIIETSISICVSGMPPLTSPQ